MKKKLFQSLQIPEGILCNFENKSFICKKDAIELKREIDVPQMTVKVEGNQVSLICEKGNKNQHALIMTFMAHIANMFRGLQEKFVYKLETVNVHFPMTLKVEVDRLTINNFYGEKVPRFARIMPEVEVVIKGKDITISSHDREAAGQTAANFEKATKVKSKDKRIYQDGLYIVEKPARSSLAAARKPAAERGASQQEQVKRGGGEGH